MQTHSSFPLSGTMHKRALPKKVGFDQEGAKAVLPDRVH
jgi:hypothetical protein